MANEGVFRFDRILRGAPLVRASIAACALVAAAPVIALAGCGDVEIVTNGIAPTVDAIEPAKGPSVGGTPVVITGEGFDPGAIVRFGGELATEVKWVDAKTISAVTPSGSGAVAVSVENPSHLVDTKEDGFTYEGAGTGCAIVSTTPGVGADEVPIVGELRLAFSAPIDEASLQGAVTLKLLGGDEVPVDVTFGEETNAEIFVRPKQSLRFWGTYALSVGEGVTTTDGAACAPGALAFATVKPKAVPRALRPALVSGVAIQGGFAVVASEGYKGLQTYAVGSVAAAELASDFVTKAGPRGVVIHGSIGYAPSGLAGVQIFDLTDATKPVLLGHAGTPGRANDVAVVEQGAKVYLVIADGAEGIRVVDATDPTTPADVGTIPLTGVDKPVIGALDRQGDRIVAANGSKLHVIQMADPAAPGSATLLGTFDAGGAIGDLVISGDRVFASLQATGVASYDISNPADVKVIDSESDPDGPCPTGCLDAASTVVKDGGDLFVAFGRGGVQRFAIDAAGALSPSTIYAGGVSNARTVAVSGSIVYVGADEGLYLFDRNGDGASPSWVDPSGHGIARTAAVSGQHLYVGDWLRGVQTFSLADVEAPALIDRDDTPGGLSDVGGYGTAASDGVLAVGDGRAGVTLFDLANPANPAIGGTVDTVDALTTVVKVGSIVYGCDGNQGIVAVDAGDPKAPVVLSEAIFDPPGNAAPDLAPAGGVMYVATRFGLGVLDIHDPSALAWKGIVPLPQKAGVSSVRVVGTHVVATSSFFDFEGTNNSATRLHVFDASDPLAPVLVWSSDDLGGAAHLAIAGDVAFVASGGASVKVFDLADIEHPVLEGLIETPANTGFTAVGAGVLYAVEGAGGVQAIHTGPLPVTK